MMLKHIIPASLKLELEDIKKKRIEANGPSSSSKYKATTSAIVPSESDPTPASKSTRVPCEDFFDENNK
jgi:hypothetical protein